MTRETTGGTVNEKDEALLSRTLRRMKELGIPQGMGLPPRPARPAASHEEQIAHLNAGTCDCHDSWDQCPCAEGGHSPGCQCCPLGTGLCGPKSIEDLLRDLAVECWACDDGNSLPGMIPELLDRIKARVDWLRP